MNHYEIIESLTCRKREEITFSDNGFLSYGYIIGDGEIIFKFKKNETVSYQNEIEILNYINSRKLGVNLQKCAFASHDDSYLGIYGVRGFDWKEPYHFRIVMLPEADELRAAMRRMGEFLDGYHQK